jgi:hypothetical protein
VSVASAARQSGDDYQAYRFWMLVADMMRRTSQIVAVGYEVGDYKAFDDVAVRYTQPRMHAHGIRIDADYFQVKYSVNYGKAITASALVDPAFSGAQSVSFLERLRDAVRTMPSDASHRFVLTTTRLPDPNDALSDLLNTSDGSINCKALFEGKTSKSRMGALRHLWASALGLTDHDELVPILERLKIDLWPQALLQTITELNVRLELAGLRSWPEAKRANPYPPLVRKLCAEGKCWFTSDCVLNAAKQDGLLLTAQPASAAGSRLGIRTFTRWAENMEDETDAMLCLCEHFADRHIRTPKLWASKVVPSVTDFLKCNVKSGLSYTLDLQALTSVAFLVGYLLDPKLNVNVSIAQDRGGRPWQVDISQIRSVADRWVERFSTLDHDEGLAVGIGVSRPVSEDIVAYAGRTCLRAQVLLNLEFQEGPGLKTIANATDAYGLAQHAVTRIAEARKTKGIEGPTHLFVAGPNVFSFFLGQLSRPLGKIMLYEFDFGSGQAGAYAPSLCISRELRL